MGNQCVKSERVRLGTNDVEMLIQIGQYVHHLRESPEKDDYLVGELPQKNRSIGSKTIYLQAKCRKYMLGP
jgi:hypothetical protein